MTIGIQTFDASNGLIVNFFRYKQHFYLNPMQPTQTVMQTNHTIQTEKKLKISIAILRSCLNA